MSQVSPADVGVGFEDAGVRTSQISVLSQTSSAEDLLANLQDFPHISSPFALLDQPPTRLSPSPPPGHTEFAPMPAPVKEAAHDQQLTPTKASLPLDMDDPAEREQVGDAGQGREKVLVDTSRLLRTHPNLVMEHYDPDTNVHTFKISYPSRDHPEQQQLDSPDSPVIYSSAPPGAAPSTISSPSTLSYSGSSSSSNSGPRDRRMANASTASYYVDDTQRSPPASVSSSPLLTAATTTPFIRRKVSSPADRQPRAPPDDIKFASLPLPPARAPADPPRRQHTYPALDEPQSILPLQPERERDRRQFPPVSAGSRTARLMSADELGAYREFLTRRAEDLCDDRGGPSPAPTRASSERAYDAASDFSWDAQSVASQSARSVVRSPLATQMIARGRPHAAVQDDLVQALQASRARQGVDAVLDPEFAGAVAQEDRHDHIRKGRSPQRVRHTPRSSTSRPADVLASPAMTALSGLEDEDALREFLPDFLDLGMDSDPRMSFAPAAATGRNLMWVLDEERALTSVPEGSAAPVRSPASSRMSYETGSSSGWNDYDYERADPILAPTPIPGSHPRKAHSTPDFAKPSPFLRPALSKTSSHSSSSPSYNGVDVDVVIDAHLRQHVRSPEDRLPPRMDTSASPHPDIQRYQRRSPLERLQTDISHMDMRDGHGHPPPQRFPPRAREPAPRDAPEIVYDRDGRAFLVRRSESSRDVPYEDESGRRVIVDRLEPLEPLEPIDPAYERPYERPTYDDYSDRHSGDPYSREGAPYSREYIARREQALQREWPQARPGAPVSRDQLVYAYRDEERHSPLSRDSAYPSPREPAYPSPRDPSYPSPRDRAYPPPVAHDLQRPPLRNRAYSATDREYVMYDDREYLEYRNRPQHGSAVYEHELASAVGRQTRPGDRDAAYSNGSHYAPSSGSGGPSPAMSPAPTTSPREQHASPVLRSNGGMSPLERALSVQERVLPPQDREAYQWRPQQQQRSPAVEDAIRRGDIADAPGPSKHMPEPSPLRHVQDPHPHPHPPTAVDQAVTSPTSPPQATSRPQEDLLKVKDEPKLTKTSSIVESVSSKSSDAGKVTRAATPAARPRVRAPSPDLMYGMSASPMGFSMVSFRSTKPAKPKPKPKAKVGPSGKLAAAGVSEPNIKGSSFSATSSEEIKSPKKGLFGRKKS